MGFLSFFPIRVASLLLAILFVGFTMHPALGATDISAITEEHFSWNDILGWFNYYSSGNVQVTDSRLKGWAESAAGEISLDCATSPAGDICTPSNYYVANNGGGVLSGYAWSDAYGWISFNCSNHSGCGTSNYSVTINPNTGVFSGYAWNDVLGWISFNCADFSCAYDYKVVTSWRFTPPSGVLDSTPIDTGVTGAQVNGITWKGVEPSGTEVRLQVATAATSTGPWNYLGPDGTSASYYTPDASAGAPLYPWIHPAGRYIAYRLILLSTTITDTPRVDDVVVRWSP